MSAQTGAQQRFGCYVGNIDSSVSLDMLKQMFCSCGTILDASLNGRTEDPYRFGFIDFGTEEARDRALKYNGYVLVGRKLRVNISKGNVGKPEGYGNTSAREHRPPHQGGGMHMQQQPQQQPYGGAAPTAGGSGLSAADQQQAQFLLQLIQQGSVDPATLNEAQRTLLVAALSGGSVNADGTANPTAAAAPAPAAAAPPVPMPAAAAGPMMSAPMGGMPPMGMYNPMWNPMQGQYGGMPYGAPMMPGMMMGMYGQQQHNQRPQRNAANPPPSEELVKLREIQKKQFMKVVNEETEAYVKKYVDKKDGAKSGEDSSESDGDDEDAKKDGGEANAKKAKVEISGADDGDE